ncbi:sulfotransferase domain-containing protein [Candidatus Chloroploca sp. M-50]|uniref:Sulfotransferase domain-containing protein n=1 Tax=Candidatus Chloroploca mongolica TaxID=2528176 RepID=A0ABS4D482_9CHLR|nr:sulfotransferase domain-containing protein [Candidatus Chloroploca mongolica]MBP1464233.1 sulfotransferase domain-containing protein [Candidatus Chloroploca mongolica]
MIIVANGAPKSGSTWLFHIARELTNFGPPPAEYASPKWISHPIYGLSPAHLARFLADAGNRSANVLLKNHFGQKHQRDLLFSHPQVRVLNIKREIRDVVVSAYYHRVLTTGHADNEVFADFPTYYWQKGRKIAQRVLDYQIIWDVRSARYTCVTYTGLRTDFTGEVQRIGDFLDVSVTAARIEQIRQLTSPAALTERYGYSDLNRFRQGEEGEWRSHFNADIEADIALLITRSHHMLHRMALTGPAGIQHLCRLWLRMRDHNKIRPR